MCYKKWCVTQRLSNLFFLHFLHFQPEVNDFDIEALPAADCSADELLSQIRKSSDGDSGSGGGGGKRGDKYSYWFWEKIPAELVVHNLLVQTLKWQLGMNSDMLFLCTDNLNSK